MNRLSLWFFGSASFPQREEYDEFRYKFLIALMLSGALFTALFVAGEYAKVNRIQTPHFWSMHLYTAASIVSWLVLRGRKHLFTPMAWVYEALSMMEFTSSLWLVPADELRLQWFFVNVPGVFVLLGQRAGWFIVTLTVGILLGSNAHMPTPYSGNAMATGVFSLIYLGVFFHIYGARSVSYFVRMRDFNQQLEDQASHDPLTGVLNARAYYARCDQLVQLATRTGQPYAVLFVDLDHFKRVNDQFGHQAGDTVLKNVSACLAGTIRRSDVLGRIGGEEFCIFLPDTARPGALQLAEALRQAVETCNPDIGTQQLRVTASIGVAVCAQEVQSIASLQQHADQAMYIAKSQGRNRVSAFDELELNT